MTVQYCSLRVFHGKRNRYRQRFLSSTVDNYHPSRIGEAGQKAAPDVRLEDGIEIFPGDGYTVRQNHTGVRDGYKS